MKVQQEDNDKKGEFYIEIEGNRAALMTYTWAGKDKLIIDHTEVGDALRGKGAGYKLVAAFSLYFVISYRGLSPHTIKTLLNWC